MGNEYLNKEEILFKRGENGKLLPVEVILETLPKKPKVKIIPLTRGKIQELTNMNAEELKSYDEQIIVDYCTEPKFTVEELRDLLPAQYSVAIATAIMALSLGVSQSDFQKKGTDNAIETAEFMLKKK